jgi:CRP-like cAMP-binding protein
MAHLRQETLSDLVGRLLPGLPASSIRTLASIGRDERPALGTFLMREGRPTTDLGLIVEGRLAVRDRVGTEDVTLMTLEAGDVFGWSAVLDGISTASIVASDDPRVLLFGRSDLLAAIEADRAIALVVYRRLLEAVASRLDATRLLMRDVYAARGHD